MGVGQFPLSLQHQMLSWKMLLFIELAAMDFSFVPFPFSSTKLFHSKPNNMLPLRLCAKFEQIIDSNTRHPPKLSPPLASLNGFGNDFGRKSLTIDARYQHSFSRLSLLPTIVLESLGKAKVFVLLQFSSITPRRPHREPQPVSVRYAFLCAGLFLIWRFSLSAQESEILFRGGGPRNNAKN